MITIDFQYDGGLDGLEDKIREAIATKLTALTQLMHDKVIENVSGKILQRKTGELAGSIQQRIDSSAEPMIGEVFVEPASPKAWALERGGEESYPIVPVRATVLSWIGKDGAKVFARSVNHPPSKEFAYLRLALEDMEALVPEGFQQALQSVLER
jgi:hypothetical protein